eukprot:CAMPEP_0203667820 /NCGR_PEP_ID=MMETSP0090-20130426/4573_1 /ASSEMBLY_ACC=CAM_ASM_001088 /TAXON_ID=426623 /ORGANISM="Chaetoceros affinis, Strain CCMP159" /LENGTH=452 /DNA_ID=CAMNT_0050532089 /DNA_START=80 /DNA_END=1438 /DNA_ORIENTATION=+
MKLRPTVTTICAVSAIKTFPILSLSLIRNTSTSTFTPRRRISTFASITTSRNRSGSGSGSSSNQFHPHNHSLSSISVSRHHDTVFTKSARMRTCIAVPENAEHRAISSEIAETLGLPLLDYQQSGGDEASRTGSEAASTYDNCIHVTPYQYQSAVESYAIAIQPIQGMKNNSKDGRVGKRQRKQTSMQPYYIDFCPPPNSKLGKRLGKGNNKNKGGEIVLKAVAPSKTGGDGIGAVVFDFNAGFGQDSIIMASGGASMVHMIERDPIVGLLLDDAMRRLKLVSSIDIDIERDDLYKYDKEAILEARELCEKLVLHQSDSIEFSRKVRSSSASNEDGGDVTGTQVLRPDVCYLDPMFPPRTKSSAVKKNMQILHGLFQNQNSDEEFERIEEEQALLEEALMLAKKRVVVKRPVTAPPLGTQKGAQIIGVKMPSYELKGSVNRFDVYVLQNGEQ